MDALSYRLDQNAPFNTTVSLKNISLNGLTIVPGSTLPSGALVAPSGIQPDAKIPTVLSYTFKIEQQFASTWSVSAGYAGSRRYHQILSIDANLPIPAISSSGAIYYPPGSPLANPKVAATTAWWSRGQSNYNAFAFDVNHSLACGFKFAACTRFRNLASIHGSWQLPFRPASRLTGGWTLSAIATLQSGFPFTPQLGFNPSNDGESRNPVRPSWNPAFQGPVDTGNPSQYFNPNAFLVPASGTYGNVGHDVLTGPGTATIDFSVLKNTALTENLKLQLRGEFFNLLNHANFGTPNTIVFSSASSGASPTAGVITSTSTPSRQIQIGAKLIW